MSTETTLLKTPLHQFHVDQGAKMTEFAGWQMPVHYGSVIEEHRATRNEATIFDVSHMARIRFSGRHARRFLERLVSRRISNQKVHTCRYALVLNEEGGVKDDVLLYRYEDHWLMVANAVNRAKLLDHFEQVRGDLAVKVEDRTEQTAMVAIQGPDAMPYLGKFSGEVPTLKKFHFCIKNLMVLKMTISRTGYTGEDGVEVILPANMISMATKLLLKENEQGELPVRPAGLGCRDSLRLEAGMPLYGHELSEELDPLSAGLEFAVSLDKDEDEEHGEPEPNIGLEALKRIAAHGSPRKLVGLTFNGRRTPREQMPIEADGRRIGWITSGCFSPTLEHPIAMAYVEPDHAQVGRSVSVNMGRRSAEAEIVQLPFYKRPKK